MSLLRFDVTTNDWVIFALERARRPHEYKRSLCPGPEPSPQEGLCPFCPGNEWMTGPEIYALRGNTLANAPGWRVRVIPNKFPALRIEEDHRRVDEGPVFRRLGGCGAHEVIIEAPDHNVFLAHQSVEQIDFLLRTLQLRFNDLMREIRFQQSVIFKNHGERAGTSLRHPHWQFIATPVVPRLLRLKHQVATDYFDQTGHCLYCDLLEEELLAGQRIVAANDNYVALMPYAAHAPFETWVLPRHHQSSFGAVDAARLQPLAELLKTTLSKLHVALEDPDFNLTINTVPRGDEAKLYFVWHMQIIPRLTTPAGFELGSGMAINLLLPEAAAAYLREVQVS